jgi:HEAT repeat protein
MCSLKIHSDPGISRGRESAKGDLRNLEKVRAIFTSLSKYIHAKTIYAKNNPNVSNFAHAFYEALRAFFEDEKELLLTIEQYQIKWRDEIVYENNKKTESIAFLLYKDGVGEISFQSLVKPTELEQLVDLMKNEIYNPSAHLDIVSRLWQAEFANISYRVFDECADGASGEGRGSGSESRERPLRVNDHKILPSADDGGAGKTAQADGSIDSLGTYFYSIVERLHSHATAHEKEEHVQNMLESFFRVSPEELRSWRDESSAMNEEDKLLRFLNIMLDFTRRRSPPSIVRDIQDIIERLVRYIVEEANVPTLIALLDIQRQMERSRAAAIDFQSLPDRIKDELTNSAFLLSLGRITNRKNNDVHEILHYFQLIGEDAVPGVCELLANSKDPSVHKEACDTLITIAGDDIMRIATGFNLDNPYEAGDAIYLVRRSGTFEVPPVIKKLMFSPDVQVRVDMIEYLVHLGSDEAAQLLCRLLEDDDVDVRTRAFAAVEDFKHPLIIDKVIALCFTEDVATKSTDELEHMFRTVGKLAGEKALSSTRQMIKEQTWFRSAKTRGKQNKLLAITALRYISGGESLKMLKKLAADRESLVRTKALYVLKQLEVIDGVSGEKRTRVGGKAAG